MFYTLSNEHKTDTEFNLQEFMNTADKLICKIYYFQFQRATTPIIDNPELYMVLAI